MARSEWQGFGEEMARSGSESKKEDDDEMGSGHEGVREDKNRR